MQLHTKIRNILSPILSIAILIIGYPNLSAANGKDATTRATHYRIPTPKLFSSKNTKKVAKKKKQIKSPWKKNSTYNLLSAYKLALKNNPQFAINKYDSTGPEAARATLEGARGALLPMVMLTSTPVSYTKSGANFTGVSFTLNQTLLNFNQWYNYLFAKYSNKAALSSFVYAQQSTINQVAKAYFQILIDESQVSLQIQKVKSDKEIYKQTNERYKVGLTPITDVKQAESQYLVDQAALLQYKNNVIADKRALQALIKVYPENVAPLKKSIRYKLPQPNNVNTWITKSYNTSAQLKASQASFQASKENYKAQWSNRYLPSLNLKGAYGWADITGGGHIFKNKKASFYTGSLALNMNLINSPLTAAAKTAKISSINSRYLNTQTKRSLRETISLDFNNIQLYIQQINAYKKAVEAAEISYKAALAGYEVGTQTITTVQQQLTDLYQAKNQESDAKFYYILGWLQFKQDLGLLSVKDIINANNFLTKV